jgi:hypothetical protein
MKRRGTWSGTTISDDTWARMTKDIITTPSSAPFQRRRRRRSRLSQDGSSTAHRRRPDETTGEELDAEWKPKGHVSRADLPRTRRA